MVAHHPHQGAHHDPQHEVLRRRNGAVITGSGLILGLVMLYPSSTNSAGHQRPGTQRQPSGVVPPDPHPVASKAPPSSTNLIINGNSVDTAYGPVQVQITLRSGHLVAAKAIDYPQGTGRDQEINSYAIPILQTETVQAQSSQIDTVSGATYTSDGYLRSLQSALDVAHKQ